MIKKFFRNFSSPYDRNRIDIYIYTYIFVRLPNFCINNFVLQMHVFDRIERAYSDLLMSDHYIKYYLTSLWPSYGYGIIKICMRNK